MSRGSRDYRNHLPSLKAQNRKLLTEREVLRDQTRTLLEEREKKDAALVKLTSILTDVKRELGYAIEIPSAVEWEELPDWVEREVQQHMAALRDRDRLEVEVDEVTKHAAAREARIDNLLKELAVARLTVWGRLWRGVRTWLRRK
jgi:hypothetical protein